MLKPVMTVIKGAMDNDLILYNSIIMGFCLVKEF